MWRLFISQEEPWSEKRSSEGFVKQLAIPELEQGRTDSRHPHSHPHPHTSFSVSCLPFSKYSEVSAVVFFFFFLTKSFALPHSKSHR